MKDPMDRSDRYTERIDSNCTTPTTHTFNAASTHAVIDITSEVASCVIIYRDLKHGLSRKTLALRPKRSI